MLQNCQSELVGAGTKLSSQCFGLALNIRSLVQGLGLGRSRHTHSSRFMHALKCVYSHSHWWAESTNEAQKEIFRWE